MLIESGISLQWAIEMFLEDNSHYSRGTRDNYKYSLGQLVNTFGPVALATIGQREIRAHFFGREGRPGLRDRLAPSTFNLHRQLLDSFFRYCVEQEWITANPISKRSVRREAEGHEPRLFLGSEQMWNALESRSDPRDRAVLAVAMNTALRRAEIRNLFVENVDLARGVLYAEIAKGNKKDEVPMTADLDSELRRWLVAYTEDVGDLHSRTCDPLRGNIRLCPERDWGRPLCPRWFLLPPRMSGQFTPSGRARAALKPTTRFISIRQVFNRALVDIGVRVVDEGGRVQVGRGTGTHTWRRSTLNAAFEYFSSHTDDPGAALAMTARLAHHSSVTTTERYLNMDHLTNKRNALLQGKSFHPRVVGDNVVPLVREA